MSNCKNRLTNVRNYSLQLPKAAEKENAEILNVEEEMRLGRPLSRDAKSSAQANKSAAVVDEAHEVVLNEA